MPPPVVTMQAEKTVYHSKANNHVTRDQRAEFLQNCRSKLWRLNNLYFIKNKAGKKVRFRMTPEQLDYFENMHTRNIILKARQLGFTTEVCIIMLDCAMWESGVCVLIAHNLQDAGKLFREKVKYAYDCLPAEIRGANPSRNDRAGELVFAKGGSITVSTSSRGGTLRYLHVSEFGKICAKYPERAREIVTGAFEAVSKDCVITIESTAEGSAGYFFDYCQEAQKLDPRSLSRLDFRFFFYPWYKNPEYSLEEEAPIPSRLHEYFARLELEVGLTLTGGQKRWYAAKERTLGEDMTREYPSTPAEAFKNAIKGAYYAKQFTDLYARGKIGVLPAGNNGDVMTFWDLGIGDSTSIWFVRKVGNEYQIIDYYSNSGEGLRHYAKILRDKARDLGYRYSKHVAPHDIENRQMGQDAKSLKDIARAGFEIDGVTYSLVFDVAPRLSVDSGIEAVREILPKCAFDASRCEEGLKGLEHYRKEWDDDKGIWKDKPLHDWASHPSDAFRYFAVSMQNKVIPAKKLRAKTVY